MTHTEQSRQRALIIDAITEVMDMEKIQEKDMLSVALYRCLDLFYRNRGEEGLHEVLRMWDDIARLSGK